jgi:hypothetical protein
VTPQKSPSTGIDYFSCASSSLTAYLCMAEDYEVPDAVPLTVAEEVALFNEGVQTRARLANMAASMRMTPGEFMAAGQVTGRQRTDEQMRSELREAPVSGTRPNGGHEAILALNDAENALRAGDHEEALRILFIWAQRSRRILLGQETWRQNYSGRRRPKSRPADPELVDAFQAGVVESKTGTTPVDEAVPDDDDVVDAEIVEE